MRRRRLGQIDGECGYEWASVRWLRRQIYEGHLRSYKVAGVVLVDLDDIDAMVEAGRREPVS